MLYSKKKTFSYYLALICAIWFALTSAFWTYYANIMFSFPVGIISFLLWNKNSKIQNTLTRLDIIKTLLIIGVVGAIVSFFIFL